ncbi:hypothetical protein AB0I00_18965 [Streptomyces sp. NPDC050803]|uniref:hypothetical protein n=1 Tax=unclassified Streptomyces TaxID=2593676 RepID=UPI003436A923
MQTACGSAAAHEVDAPSGLSGIVRNVEATDDPALPVSRSPVGLQELAEVQIDHCDRLTDLFAPSPADGSRSPHSEPL